MNRIYWNKQLVSILLSLIVLSCVLKVSIVHAQEAIPLYGCVRGKPDCVGSDIDTNVKGYEIISKSSGKCMDIANRSNRNGANVRQWTCHGGENQLFILERVKSYYIIRPKNSNKCLDVTNRSNIDGANVQQWTCHDGDNQLFIIADVGGYFVIQPRHNSYKCLEVAGKSEHDGANVQQWSCHSGGDNRLWEIIPRVH